MAVLALPMRYDTNMPFTIDEAFLPATLTAPPMTDQQFADFCAENPDLFFETNARGEIIVMPPNFSITGARNSEITMQLTLWVRKDARGIANDSSAGFLLPNGARRSPDASWTPKDDIRKLPDESRDGYWHLCPAFVIELRSNSDRLPVLREKMEEYLANGAHLGWMIDPETHTVEVYRPDRGPETLTGIDSIVGEGPIAGFVLDLKTVWDPLAA
jgi:Uma2 family endonuclease